MNIALTCPGTRLLNNSALLSMPCILFCAKYTYPTSCCASCPLHALFPIHLKWWGIYTFCSLVSCSGSSISILLNAFTSPAFIKFSMSDSGAVLLLNILLRKKTRMCSYRLGIWNSSTTWSIFATFDHFPCNCIYTSSPCTFEIVTEFLFHLTMSFNLSLIEGSKFAHASMFNFFIAKLCFRMYP